MSVELTALIEAITTELAGLGYKISSSPLDESAKLDSDRKAWITNPTGEPDESYSQHYDDTENIIIAIMEKRTIKDHTDVVKLLGDRRDLIRLNMTNEDFHDRLPTILKKVEYDGHVSDITDTAIMAALTFKFTIRRSL